MLSVVVTSRNDDHGGNLLSRMQHFVDGLAAQCRRHGLAAELVLVEWNPPADRPSLAAALRWPRTDEHFSARIVQVSPELHARLAHAGRLPLFQMIAKNVGIRRARGDFVLATNIDILFSDALMRYLRGRLGPGKLYRVDRYDVPSDPPEDRPFEEVLRFCESNVCRINKKDCVYVVKERRRYPIYQSLVEVAVATAAAGLREAAGLPAAALQRFWAAVTELPAPRRAWLFRARRAAGRLARDLARFPWKVASGVFRLARATLAGLRRYLAVPRLHTNACGDFTLMSRDDWFALRGYPEWPMFSWHLDSVLLHQAYGNGMPVVELPDPMRIYHIEHGVGSGWTPDGEAQLFARIEKAGVPYLGYEDFFRTAREIRANAKAGRRSLFNGGDWGLARESLPETVCVPTPRPAHVRAALETT